MKKLQQLDQCEVESHLSSTYLLENESGSAYQNDTGAYSSSIGE